MQTVFSANTLMGPLDTLPGVQVVKNKSNKERIVLNILRDDGIAGYYRKKPSFLTEAGGIELSHV